MSTTKNIHCRIHPSVFKKPRIRERERRTVLYLSLEPQALVVHLDLGVHSETFKKHTSNIAHKENVSTGNEKCNTVTWEDSEASTLTKRSLASINALAQVYANIPF